MPRLQPDIDNDEHSPLIDPQRKSEDSDIDPRKLSDLQNSSKNALHLEDSIVESRGTWYLIFLTLSIGGLQIVWSIELSNGSPYLLSLGMSKALVAFVWLAGPMTGVLVQPYVGMLSDRCRISWGKRKPFMIAGTLGTVGSSLLLAYAKQITQVIGGWSADADYDGYWKGTTIVYATIMMWVLDFSINMVQSAIRAFIVDGAPAHQQEEANSWASRIVGIGNLFGYIAGYLDLPKHFAFLGREQFQVLCAFASIVLTTLVFISVVTVKERNPQLEPPSRQDYQSGVLQFFKQVLNSIQKLPAPIRVVCEIQFCHWMGWFPFLFYITTYVGQLYANPRLRPDLSPEEVDTLWAQATRVGTFALLIEAVVSLSTNVLVPFLIVPTYKSTEQITAEAITPSSPIETRSRRLSYSDTAHQQNALNRTQSSHSTMTDNLSELGGVGPRSVGSSLQRGLKRLRIPGLTLRRAWGLSQLLFSACMFSTFFISSPTSATVMVAIMGVAWSLSLWAPFALIAAEISKRDEARRSRHRRKLLSGDSDSLNGAEEEEEDRAGIILGLHNVAVSAPQVVATLICSVVFKALQKPRNEPGDVSVAWTLRLGGVAGLAAAFLTFRMRESVDEDVEESR